MVQTSTAALSPECRIASFLIVLWDGDHTQCGLEPWVRAVVVLLVEGVEGAGSVRGLDEEEGDVIVSGDE